MMLIIFNNYGFWLNLLIPIATGLYFFITNKEFIWKEFVGQIFITSTILFLTFLLLFASTTDLLDEEYWNGKVKSFTYYEEWTERITYMESYSCGTSKSPRTCTRTKTRYDRHPAYWVINTTNNEEIRISRSDFRSAVAKYGKKEINIIIGRTNQSSFGDGDKYVSYPNEVLPTSVSHSYTNYVVAAKDNVMHHKFSPIEIKDYVKKGWLIEYPKTYKGIDGVPKLNRVVSSVKGLNKTLLQKQLDYVSVKVGKAKQANPNIYITDQDRDFKDAIEYHWSKGKKNDVTLVIGVDKERNISWTEVICFTNETDVFVDGSKWFTKEKLNLEKDSTKIIKLFEKLITDVYIRKPMEEFEYLAENITLAWYWQFLVLILNGIGSFFLVRHFITNNIRN